MKLVLHRPLRDGRAWGTVAGLPLLALGLPGQAWVVATAAFIGGLGFTVAAITWESTLQAAVPNEHLARVAVAPNECHRSGPIEPPRGDRVRRDGP